MSSQPTKPTIAMVLAAGLGKRMRSHSSTLPKPMVSVAGASLINRVLNKLNNAGISKTVVNLHHKADLLEKHLKEREQGPEIIISDERNELLETGGGVKKALPLLGDDPFFVINSDALWDDPETPALLELQNFWDSNKMDVLMLTYPTEKIPNYSGTGDFYQDAENKLSRPNDGCSKPFIFAGVQIINPKIMSEFPYGSFSLNKVYDKAISKGRLYGVSLNGIWHHVGSGEEVELAEQYYSKN